MSQIFIKTIVILTDPKYYYICVLFTIDKHAMYENVTAFLRFIQLFSENKTHNW